MIQPSIGHAVAATATILASVPLLWLALAERFVRADAPAPSSTETGLLAALVLAMIVGASASLASNAGVAVWLPFLLVATIFVAVRAPSLLCSGRDERLPRWHRLALGVVLALTAALSVARLAAQ